MKETIQKPITVIRQEFIEKLVDEVENCQLPLFVIEPILQDLLNMVKVTSQKQYEAEKAQDEEQLLKQKETK